MKVTQLDVSNVSRWVRALIYVVKAVFAEKPWSQHKKCSVCGKHWSSGERAPWFHCRKLVRSFWKDQEIRAMFTEAVTSPSGTAFIATETDTYYESTWIGWDNYTWETTGEFLRGFIWGFAESPRSVQQRIDQKGSLFFASLAPDTQVGYLSAIGVKKKFRQKHVAEQLFTQWEESVISRGATCLVLRTHTESPMYTWMLRKGFEMVDTYETEDQPWRVIMAKKLH
jgi:hypothetical protein